MTDIEAEQVTRAAYDTVAARYAALFLGELTARPLDRALLAGVCGAGPGLRRGSDR